MNNINTAHRRSSATGRESILIVLAVVLLLTMLHLHYPFNEDQALFMYAAREMTDGAQMYREFWDMKQPGIYWWYLAVGSIFSFDAVGLRWMDVVWSLCVAGVLWAAVRQRGALAAVLAPCFGFASFYGRASINQFSQVEWIVGGPIAVVLWCVGVESKPGKERATAGRYAIAGAMLAIVALFKTMLVILPMAVIVTAIAHARWKDRIDGGSLIRWRVAPMFAGCLFTLLPVVIWMQLNGTLTEALWTAFVYPGIAVREYEHNTILRLLGSTRWFLIGTVALVPWAAWAAFNGLRHRSRLELLCTAWCAGAMIVIPMQVLSFWDYHFDLLFLPLGVLAALGFVDALYRLGSTKNLRYRQAAIALMIISVLINFGWPLGRKVVKVFAAMPFTAASQSALDNSLDARLSEYKESVEAVRGIAGEQDRIVVWGDARMHFMLQRRPVIEINGSTFYLARQLEQVVSEIREKKPKLIYLSKERDRMTYHGGGILPITIKEMYEPAYDNRFGTWYRLRSGAIVKTTP